MRHVKITGDGRLALGVLQVAAVLLLSAGCGGPKEPTCYDLSGKVTYRGAPVPHGFIIFTPDRTKGNEGRPISVLIANGEYRTVPGGGPTGGPYVATISSVERVVFRPGGRQRKPPAEPLFPQVQMSIDLPHHNSTHDFVVPAE